MNKKLTVRTEDKRVRFCVLSDAKDAREQLYEVLDIRKGYGYGVELYDDSVRIVDVFHGETRACFDVLSFEDTDLAVSLSWNDVQEN